MKTNTIELIEKLRKKPVFSLNDITRLCYCSREYSKIILNRLLKRNLIQKITKNRYTISGDIYVIASNLKYPGYVSFWAASSYLGYTEQILNTIQIATTQKYKEVDFQGYKIKFIPMKYFFGYKKQRTEQGEIFIVEPEKLLLDCMLKQKEIGNFDEIIKIFKNAEISKRKVVLYLKKIKNQSLIKRVGFMLERYKKIDISKNFELDTNYINLNLFSKKKKKTDSKWRVYYDN